MEPKEENTESTAKVGSAEKGCLAPDTGDAIPPTQTEPPYSSFSDGTRRYLTVLLGVSLILSTMTATMYFPLIPALSRGFSVSIQSINLTVTVYAACQALSPTLFASLADHPAIGRRPVLLALMVLYALGSLGLLLNTSDSYAVLMVMRGVQSIAGSPITAIAYGVVADVSVVAERGKMLGPMMSICNGISATGPVIGGAIALVPGGYTWVFLTLLLISVACLLVSGFTLPETSRVVVGNGEIPPTGVWRTWWSWLAAWRRNLKRDKNSDSASVEEARDVVIPPPSEDRPRWNPRSVLTSLRLMFHPDAAVVLWTIASTYSIYYTYQVAIPTIFDEIYGYNELFIGLSFLPGLVGMTLGGIVAGKLMDHNFAAAVRKHDVVQLAGRTTTLSGTELGGFPIEATRYRYAIPIVVLESLLVAGYGWAVTRRAHAAVPLVLQFFTCALSTLMSHTASALLVEIFPRSSSSAYAAGQMFRCGLSAVSAAVLQPVVDAVGRGWFFVIFAVFIGTTTVASILTSVSRGMRWRERRLGQGSQAGGLQ
ncbi:major facilitator superfamily domain-containing protein [Xylariomycetidae sp. FL2044]|nr:major facilitator superfamily domain-containing protein [Xylariomycetidae sp. FL2044]